MTFFSSIQGNSGYEGLIPGHNFITASEINRNIAAFPVFTGLVGTFTFNYNENTTKNEKGVKSPYKDLNWKLVRF